MKRKVALSHEIHASACIFYAIFNLALDTSICHSLYIYFTEYLVGEKL